MTGQGGGTRVSPFPLGAGLLQRAVFLPELPTGLPELVSALRHHLQAPVTSAFALPTLPACLLCGGSSPQERAPGVL